MSAGLTRDLKGGTRKSALTGMSEDADDWAPFASGGLVRRCSRVATFQRGCYAADAPPRAAVSYVVARVVREV